MTTPQPNWLGGIFSVFIVLLIVVAIAHAPQIVAALRWLVNAAALVLLLVIGVGLVIVGMIDRRVG